MASNLGASDKVANGARPTAPSTVSLAGIVERKRNGQVGRFLSFDGEGGHWPWWAELKGTVLALECKSGMITTFICANG